MDITQSGEPLRRGLQRERCMVASGDLVPGQGHGYPRIRHRAHRPGRGYGAVLGVLVVVDEHAVALFLPPGAGGDIRGPALDFTGEGQGRPPYLVEAPASLNPHIDMNAARA